jgi:agmatine deiminase
MINRQSELSANKVYITHVLKQLHPKFHEELVEIFKKHSIKYDYLWGISESQRPKDIWCRDYMPVQTNKGFVKFIYFPDSLLPEEKKRGLTTLDDIDFKALDIPNFNETLFEEEIFGEGGNFVKGDGITFICDKIFRENPQLSTQGLYNKLTDYFGKIIIIPQMPVEVIGHADGYVRYIGNGKVVVNSWIWNDDYEDHNIEEYRTFILTLLNAGLEVIEMPNAFDEEDTYSDYGDYINYLVVDKVVIMQRYNIFEDNKAMAILKKHFPSDYIFESVDCREISKMGGALNCCTWSINI